MPTKLPQGPITPPPNTQAAIFTAIGGYLDWSFNESGVVIGLWSGGALGSVAKRGGGVGGAGGSGNQSLTGAKNGGSGYYILNGSGNAVFGAGGVPGTGYVDSVPIPGETYDVVYPLATSVSDGEAGGRLAADSPRDADINENIWVSLRDRLANYNIVIPGYDEPIATFIGGGGGGGLSLNFTAGLRYGRSGKPFAGVLEPQGNFAHEGIHICDPLTFKLLGFARGAGPRLGGEGIYVDWVQADPMGTLQPYISLVMGIVGDLRDDADQAIADAIADAERIRDEILLETIPGLQDDIAELQQEATDEANAQIAAAEQRITELEQEAEDRRLFIEGQVAQQVAFAESEAARIQGIIDGIVAGVIADGEALRDQILNEIIPGLQDDIAAIQQDAEAEGEARRQEIEDRIAALRADADQAILDATEDANDLRAYLENEANQTIDDVNAQIAWAGDQAGVLVGVAQDRINDLQTFLLALPGTLVPLLPGIPNTPSTASLVRIIGAASEGVNSVFLNGRPGGYQYWDVEVPLHANVMTAIVYGAQGQGSYGGRGGEVVVENIPVTPGETLRVAVGGEGARTSTTNAAGSAGGGASWIQRSASSNPVNPIIVAGGGGGGAPVEGVAGGDGGAAIGEDGSSAPRADGDGTATNVRGGYGGNQTTAGNGLLGWQGERSATVYEGCGGDGWRGGEAGQLDEHRIPLPTGGTRGQTMGTGGGGGSCYVTSGLIATTIARGSRTGDGLAILIFPPRLAPNKPINIAPADNVLVDSLDGPTGETFQWTYTHTNDLPQGGWSFRREIGPGVFEYWNEAIDAFVPTPVDNPGAVTQLRFPSGTWTKNVAYKWQVRVQDVPSGVSPVGEWSAWSTATTAFSGDGSLDIGASDYLEERILDLVFNGVLYPSPAFFHVGAFVSPSNDEGGTEQPSGLRSSPVTWDDSQDGAVQNENEVTLTVDPNVTIVGLGIFDSSVAGNMLVHVLLDTPISGGAEGQVFVFAPGDLVVQIR